MTIQAEVSLYPLRTRQVGAAIERFVAELEDRGLQVAAGPMSTRITGECSKLFAALGDSFAAVADQCQAVLIAKVSNACPLEGTGSPDAGQPT
jgi:uncharacterized protein YqgV (UPF0045/DUF77 family)